MSIHFVSGKPGGGKTLYSVRLIIDELLRGHRPIVTNVPLKLGAINEYLQENYPSFFKRTFQFGGETIDGTRHFKVISVQDPATPKFPPHIADRITIIDEQDVAKFFTFRGNGVRLESVNNDDWKRGKRPDFSAVNDTGVFYVLDEVHIPFNSRAWAETGSEVLYYLSQHRKLGDDVVCITQAIANVDKQFRSVAQDYTYIKNLSKQRAGLFRMPAVFTRNTFSQPATDLSKPIESGSFTLDVKGYASLYDTAKGVGIHGRAGADTKERKKGLHWMWFVILFPLLVWFCIHWVPRLSVWLMSGGHSSAPVPQHSSEQSGSAPLPVTVERPLPPAPSSVRFARVDSREVASSPVRLGGSPEVTNDVVCTGYFVFKDDATVFFSDGSMAYSDSGDVQKIEKHWVTAWNKRYRIVVGRAVSSPSPSERAGLRGVDDSQPVSDNGYVDSSVSYVPVNDAQILPTIHSQVSDIPQTPKINGIHNMRNSLSQAASYGQ